MLITRRVAGRMWTRRELRVLGGVQFAALVAVLVVGLLLDAGYVWQQSTQNLRTTSAQACLVAGLVLGPALGGGDLATATPTTVEQRLAGSFAEPTVRNAAERIELWDPTGGVVASDDRDVLGRSFPVAADLRSALVGITVAHNSDLTDPANSDGRGLAPAVEVFVPVRASTQITADITRWVLRAAAVQAANWRARATTASMSASVNPAPAISPTRPSPLRLN